MVKDNQMSSSNSITIFHQNICGLKGKTDELISSMSPDIPHILCFSEHHLKILNLIKLMLMAIDLVLHTVDKL